MKIAFKKFIPWILLLLAISGFVLWYILSKKVTEEQISRYAVILSEADDYYNAKSYALAIQKYQDATKVVPSKVEAYSGIVKILLLKNRDQDALDIVRKSAKALSWNDKSVLYGYIGDYYYNLKNYSSAKEIYQEALSIGVENPGVELMMGKTLLNLGKIREAKNQFEKDIYTGELGDEGKLLLVYIQSVEDSEGLEEKLVLSSVSQKWLPYYEEFISALDSLDDDQKFNATKLSRIFLNSGYPYLAISLLEPLDENISEYLDGLLYLGRAYYGVSKYDEAIVTLEKALSLGGMESEIFWVKGRAYLGKNDLDSSIKSYQRSIDYAGLDVSQELVEEYVKVLLDNKQTLKAQEVIKNLLLKKSDPYLFLLGLKVDYELKDSKRVDYFISELGKKDLSDTQKMEYMYWKVRVILDSQKSDGVSALLDELLALDRFNPKYYLLKGKYDLLLGNGEDAKTSFQSALEYDTLGIIAQEATNLLSNTQ